MSDPGVQLDEKYPPGIQLDLKYPSGTQLKYPPGSSTQPLSLGPLFFSKRVPLGLVPTTCQATPCFQAPDYYTLIRILSSWQFSLRTHCDTQLQVLLNMHPTGFSTQCTRLPIASFRFPGYGMVW